jgi:predicted lipoprotein with Yx(FWY)xxD motif
MNRTRSITFLASTAALPLIALTAAACSSGGGGASASPTPAKATTGQPPTVGVANSGLGDILVNSQVHTLYLFQADSGTTSACYGACATAWPALRATGQPTAGTGANASLLGTTQRSDGGPQVTYNGHPLYTFVKDQNAGDTTGQGLNAFGASWFALTSAGNQVASQAPSGSTSSPTTTSPPPPPPAPVAAPAPVPHVVAPTPPPVATRQPPPRPAPASAIPQGGGGDHDGDNSGGPSDGDGNV